MIRVTGWYRWEEGAHFDHAYYNSEHMRVTQEALLPHGLVRLESDQFLMAGAPVAGQVIAATNAYFPSLEIAQKALAAAGPALMANLPNYTSLIPQLHLSKVVSHL